MKKALLGIIIVILVAVLAMVGFKFMNSSKTVEEKKDSKVVDTIEVEDTLSDATNKTEENTTKNETNKNTTKKTGGKVLIAFFSAVDEHSDMKDLEIGNAEAVANYIKECIGSKADLFKIDPVKGYPSDYKSCVEFARYETELNARPEFKGDVNIEEYDTIFIGYPIWDGSVPMIINTFLEKYDFKGKNIELFNTHEGSGNAKTYVYIKNKLTNSNVNTKGLAVRGSKVNDEDTKVEIKDWLRELGY